MENGTKVHIKLRGGLGQPLFIKDHDNDLRIEDGLLTMYISFNTPETLPQYKEYKPQRSIPLTAIASIDYIYPNQQ